MKKAKNKTVVVLVGILVIALVSSKALLAQERKVGDMITAADLPFLTAVPREIVTKYTEPDEASSGGLLSACDLAFVSEPFSEPVVNHNPTETIEFTGLITTADHKFLKEKQAPQDYFSLEDFVDSLVGGIAR